MQPNSEAALFLSGTRHKPTPAIDDPDDVNSVSCSHTIRLIVENALENPNYILKTAQELGASLYSQCTPQQQDYYDKNIKIDSDGVLKICGETQDQDGDEWLEYKYGRLTGSISYAYHT